MSLAAVALENGGVRVACRISTAIESQRRAGEFPFRRDPPVQPQLGVVNPEGVDWLPIGPSSGIVLQAPAYKRLQRPLAENDHPLRGA